MGTDDLKLYSVKVGDGSGCLFQPMNNNEYTYILTAKHLFEGERNEDGRPEVYSTNDGDLIEIERLFRNGSSWQKESITFMFQRDVNYFVHDDADAAILIIKNIPNFDAIFTQLQFENDNNFEVCGFPTARRNLDVLGGEEYTSQRIERFLASGHFCCSAQLYEGLDQKDIEGMSGGGILKIASNHISIIGVQSKMASSSFPAGQIGFVPILYFNEIINYLKNQSKLVPLFPPYMANFNCLKDEILKLEGCVSDDFIDVIRAKLKLKVNEIALKPIDILKLPFNNQLLIYNEKTDATNSKKLWTSWLEYLIILHIVKKKVLNNEDIEQIYNEIRLIHSDENKDWQRIMSEIFRTDLYGLNEDGILIISTNKKPNKLTIEGEQLIFNIANANPVESFKTDNASKHPLQQFKFLHIAVFETECIVNKEHELQNTCTGININKLEDKLKELFDEILQV